MVEFIIAKITKWAAKTIHTSANRFTDFLLRMMMFCFISVLLCDFVMWTNRVDKMWTKTETKQKRLPKKDSGVLKSCENALF